MTRRRWYPNSLTALAGSLWAGSLWIEGIPRWTLLAPCAGAIVVILAAVAKPRRLRAGRTGLFRCIAGLALVIAGSHRANLRDAWMSDLLAEDGSPLPLPSQLRHVAGYVPAAIRYRLVNDLGGVLKHLINHLGGVLGRWLDAILVSRGRTRAVVMSMFAIRLRWCSPIKACSGW